MEILQQADPHDVIVIGSGASGGMAAYNLAAKGVKVLMLDAGGVFEPTRFWTHEPPYRRMQRRLAGERPPGFELDMAEQPHLTPDGPARRRRGDRPVRPGGERRARLGHS